MAQKGKKRQKVFIAIIGLLIVIAMSVLSLSLLKYFNDQFYDDISVLSSDDPRLEKEEQAPEGDWTVGPDRPRYMSIDKLGIVDARVVEVGIKNGTNNQLDDPINIHNVGWYNGSLRPGINTTSSLAGLYDGHNTGYSANGVFINLGELIIGDLIKIERGDGELFYYEVREVEEPLLEDVDMALMQESAQEGVEGLNIISCSGAWDEEKNTYTHRVTVRAVLR